MTAGAGTGSRPLSRVSEPAGGATAGARRVGDAMRGWRWAALPFGLVYLILLAHQLDAVIRATNLDADAASGPVIGELFAAAPAHANVVLGEFGWYSTLLFELGTKWLPHHRQVWEAAPYAMALAAAALAAWSVWQVAGRWAAALTAVVLICASPATLRLELSMTQHAPVWFCLALLGAFLVLLEQRSEQFRWPALVALVLVVGTIVGVNAGSDALVSIAGLVPFALALIVTALRVRSGPSIRALRIGLTTLATVGVAWAITRIVMSALSVTAEPELHPMRIALGRAGANFTFWWKSIAVLGNGNYFGRPLSLGSVLAGACAAISIAAVASLPWLTWRRLRGQPRRRSSATTRETPSATPGETPSTTPGETPSATIRETPSATIRETPSATVREMSSATVRAVRAVPSTTARGVSSTTSNPGDPASCAFYLFWCSSAIVLSLAFVVSAAPVDIHADRYLLGLLYAAAAVVPAAAAGHRRAEAAVLGATCVFALGGVVTLAQGASRQGSEFHTPVSAGLASQIARIAAREHVQVGYAGYWDASPVTWATHLRVRVYPVAVCDQGEHLCRFDLHIISSWYWPRARTGSFLLVDNRSSESVSAPTPGLGRPQAVYRIGPIRMYVYRYDLASRIVS
jgi:hypothetical protein